MNVKEGVKSIVYTGLVYKEYANISLLFDLTAVQVPENVKALNAEKVQDL